MRPDTWVRQADGELAVGGVRLSDLVERHGTPLYVVDVATVVNRAREWTEAVGEAGSVHYAAKAFFCRAMAQLVKQLGLGVDVVSGGELATALAAGMPPSRIIFHGNAKTDREIARAAALPGITVAVDSLEELQALSDAAMAERRAVRVLLRLTPGIEPDTHAYIKTGQYDSKFGLAMDGHVADAAVALGLSLPGVELVGYHAHIGSQMVDADPLLASVRRLMEFAEVQRNRHGYWPKVLDVGGGIGAPYHPEDEAADVGRIVKSVHQDVTRLTPKGLAVPHIAWEPGRSIVATSGVTLYRVLGKKSVPGGRRYCAVDGGMGDNIRPALYGARYTAEPVGRPRPGAETVTVAGRYCETGDVLLRDMELPPLAIGDLLAMYTTGAYNYSMASNYNRVARPPVVAVWNGTEAVWVRGETDDDVLQRDQQLAWAFGTPAPR